MKAIAYTNAHKLCDFNLKLQEVADPKIGPQDLLVRIKAISINPVDYKIRSSRSGSADRPVIIGWDASGVVEAIGENVKNFKIGDEVYYAGDLNRDGSYAELQAVDSRIAALKPKTLSFAQAAALPLTSLTAYEALFGTKFKTEDNSKVLIIGGAGGVGSMAIQLLKAKSKATVITTAAREESVNWVTNLGADIILDYQKDLKAQLEEKGIGEVDVVFCTTQSEKYLKIVPSLLRPFGHFVLIDEPDFQNLKDYKPKGLSVHWELMFTKTLFNYQVESQGKILKEIAQLIDKGTIRTTMNKVFEGFNEENIHKAHKLIESGKSIGKTVVKFN